MLTIECISVSCNYCITAKWKSSENLIDHKVHEIQVWVLDADDKPVWPEISSLNTWWNYEKTHARLKRSLYTQLI